MRYRLLGRTGLRVSELFLGAMTFGSDWGWGGAKGSLSTQRIPDLQAIAIRCCFVPQTDPSPRTSPLNSIFMLGGTLTAHVVFLIS